MKKKLFMAAVTMICSTSFAKVSFEGNTGYDPSRSLHADFSGTPLQGTAPLAIQFTDGSTGNPTVWKWDFQNDGIYDAFIQHPSFTYDKGGTYSVRLTVMNATEDDSVVKQNYITVDTGLIEQGLVAYYPFSGNANDTSGNGNHGTVSGATLTTDRFGADNSAYSFNGSDNYISIPVDINYSELPQLTMVGWAKPAIIGINPRRPIISGDNGNFDRQMCIDHRSGTTGYSAFKGTWVFGSFPATAGQWDMITVEYDQALNSVKLFKDTASMTGTTSFGTGLTYTLIGGNTDFDKYFEGVIDEIRLYDRILTDEEVMMLFELSPVMIPGICIVSVTTDDHNEVIWEKQPLGLIGSYNIYRETEQANVYEMIGSVAYDDPGIFVDMNSDPQQQDYKYKISAVDTTGKETGMSNYQKTIHLEIEAGQSGWDLAWSPFEGFPFDKYYVFRGTDPGTLVLHDSVPGSFTSYNDPAPPSGVLYYAIETHKEGVCDPGGSGVYDRSRSNVNDISVGRKDNSEASIRIFPNPAHDILTIQFEKNNVNARLAILTAQGKILVSRQVHQQEISISLGDLDPGVYIIQAEHNHNLLTSKLVVY